jgi:hypothetical protein
MLFGAGSGGGETVGVGAGLDDVAAEGEAVDDPEASTQVLSKLGSGTDLGEPLQCVTSMFDCEGLAHVRRRTPCRLTSGIDAPSGAVGRCRGRLWTVMVLVMQTDGPFWDSLVFDGIDEVDVEAVTAAFGTIEVVARGRAAGAACPDCGRFSDSPRPLPAQAEGPSAR